MSTFINERMVNKNSTNPIIGNDIHTIFCGINPRDEIDYESLFPDVTVCRLRVPSQLFDMSGVRFEIAATYFSAAVLDFSYDIRVDWYADELMQKLKFLNHCSPPSQNINKCKL